MEYLWTKLTDLWISLFLWSTLRLLICLFNIIIQFRKQTFGIILKPFFWQFNLIIFFSNFFHKNKANCLTNNWLALASPHFKPFPPTRDKKWPQPSPLFKSIQIFREWSYRTTKNPKYWILNKTTYIANSKKMTYYIQIPS